MSFRNVEQMHPYFNEGYKLLREKFKFGAQESKQIVQDVWMTIAMKPHTEELKNPKRTFLHALRGWAARLRRQEKAWAKELEKNR